MKWWRMLTKIPGTNWYADDPALALDVAARIAQSMPLFFADGKVNRPEALARMRYWIEYAKTGAGTDVGRALESLSILHRILEREEKNGN